VAISRERLSLWIALSCGLFIAAFGARSFLLDGSYYLDEASVVLSLDGLTASETFRGKLAGGGQNFPRFYLLLIRGVRALLGPETWATRLLPFLAFLAATALWMRLLVVRFGARPELVLLGPVLLAMSPSWWIFGIVVKQYSLDIFVTLALLSVPDRVLSEVLGSRRRLGWGLLLVVPVLFSYVYPVVLTARVTGWLAWKLRRGLHLDLIGSGSFLLGLATATATLWFTDLQHTLGQPKLIAMWSQCVLSQNPQDFLEIVRRSFASWYVGPSEFVFHPKLSRPALFLAMGALGLGALRAARSLFTTAASETDERWGSRSVVCLAGIVGMLATSFLLDYPICAGRLTLYALFFQQLLLLEGIDWLRDAAGHRRALQALVAMAIAFLLASGSWTASAVIRRVDAVAPVEDVRPLLERIPDRPSERVLVTACMERQIRTLPEGLGSRQGVYLPLEGWQSKLPAGQEIWIVHSRLVPGLCESMRRKLLRQTRDVDRPNQPKGGAVVYHARVLTREERREKRKKTLRAVRKLQLQDTADRKNSPRKAP
jgi:hypothetical protein